MPAATVGCSSLPPVRCRSASVASARLSPIFPSASTASSCSGPSSMATSVELRHGVGAVEVAERLDDRAAEVVDAAGDVDERAPSRTFGSSPTAASARMSDGRTNSPSSLASAVEKSARERAIGVALEIAVRHLAQPIVRRRQRFLHLIRRARIVETGQQHQAAKADVAVLVFARPPAAARAPPRRTARGARRGQPWRERRSRGRRAWRWPRAARRRVVGDGPRSCATQHAHTTPRHERRQRRPARRGAIRRRLRALLRGAGPLPSSLSVS